jgi:outer membrane protein assembly factor BamD (BamD/ComL family)
MKKLFCLIFLLIVSCGQSPKQLFETAELEMLQTNYPHATELYREILNKHPDSKFAENARKRLRELRPGGGGMGLQMGNRRGKDEF